MARTRNATRKKAPASKTTSGTTRSQVTVWMNALPVTAKLRAYQTPRSMAMANW